MCDNTTALLYERVPFAEVVLPQAADPAAAGLWSDESQSQNLSV